MALTQDDQNLLVLLSSSASLDASPKKNWVENSGGLPPYVRKIARGIMKSGKTKDSAIAIAISRIKKWAAGGDSVDADTQAQAAKALAAWESLKAKNKSKKLVKASRESGEGYLMLSNIGSFNTEIVRRAWNEIESAARQSRRAELKAQGKDEYGPEAVPYTYIRELWTDHIIVEVESYGSEQTLAKVPYEVMAGGIVGFGEPIEVKQQYVEVPDDDDLNEIERMLLEDVLILSKKSPLATIAGLTTKK